MVRLFASFADRKSIGARLIGLPRFYDFRERAQHSKEVLTMWLHLMRSRVRVRLVLALAGVLLISPAARAALPPGNAVQQWNKIAEDTVVGAGAFQNEGL